ncbi:hypothetical protein FIU95_10420 [Microbulbifer sp. THAF38]|nr:hypothetical protein FIU95_10420 [Microbulbifer sp. THAF38]
MKSLLNSRGFTLREASRVLIGLGLVGVLGFLLL